MSFKIPSWLPIIVKLGGELADLIVDGSKLNDEMKGTVKVVYYGFKEFEDNIINDPENDFTKETIDALYAFCEDTAKEGGFQLDIPQPN